MMTDSHSEGCGLGAKLLQLDNPLNDREYEEYRVKLEDALTKAERAEKRVGLLAVTSFAVGLGLMFVGGTKVLGSFDPFDKDATVLSVALGTVYVVAAVLFPLSLAAYFSRYRPRVKRSQDDIRDARISNLQRELRELRKEIAAMSRQDTPS